MTFELCRIPGCEKW